jgi:hypothetical protein
MVHPDMTTGTPQFTALWYANYLKATLVAISVPISMSTSLPLYTCTDLHV